MSGSSTNGTGVQGSTTGTGAAGVLGVDTSSGGGARVQASSTHGTGVIGTSGHGTGVSGTSAHGTGVHAASSGGTALAVTGKVTFSRSGTATIAGGSKSVTVSLGGVTPSSLVFATLQRPMAGIVVAAAQPGTGSFTITLTANTAASLPVAWFIIG